MCMPLHACRQLRAVQSIGCVQGLAFLQLTVCRPNHCICFRSLHACRSFHEVQAVACLQLTACSPGRCRYASCSVQIRLQHVCKSLHVYKPLHACRPGHCRCAGSCTHSRSLIACTPPAALCSAITNMGATRGCTARSPSRLARTKPSAIISACHK